MNRKIIVLAAALGIIALAGIAAALVSSYGSITGTAVVRPAISWDILESYSDVNTSATNDTYYQLKTSYQGETKWVKIKIKNAANTALPVNVSIIGNMTDIQVSVWDTDKSAPLANPIEVPPTDVYVWLKHDILATASPGSYAFEVSFVPARTNSN